MQNCRITINTSPRIYVACLASYNAGKLFGRWIDATQDPEDIQKAIKEILDDSPSPSAEEWAIHDYEHFGDLPLNEHESIDRVSAIAKAVEQYPDSFPIWYGTGDVGHIANDELVEQFEMAFRGAWDSEEDFAENLLSECGDLDRIPEDLRTYFDFKAYARDLSIGGCYWYQKHGPRTYVFEIT